MAPYLPLAAAHRVLFVLGIIALLAVAATASFRMLAGPALANPLTAVASVSAGARHTCAVTTAGAVTCWGNNEFGQLGGPATATCAGFPCNTTPVEVSGLTSDVVAVNAGPFESTCAVTTAGGVKCWGDNTFGQLGDGTTTNQSAPIDVVGLTSGVASVAAGQGHTCVVTTAGGIKCWGRNDRGELGDGTTTPSFTPVDVVGLTSGAAAVSAGGGHTCALTTAGGVTCWGRNAEGQLGNGATTNQSTPGDVIGLTSGIVAISVGGAHTCALTSANGIKCWGSNELGRSGPLSTGDCGADACNTVPVDVLNDAVAVAAGLVRTCALTTSGGIKCWGAGIGGTPMDVPKPMTNPITITAGGDHACVLTTTGGVACWGGNGSGELGNGTTFSSSIPIEVVAFDAKPTPTATPCPAAGCPTPMPCPAEACMQLQVKDGAIPCPAATPAGQVCVELGTGFILAVDVVKAPAAGYIGIQTYLDYGSILVYKKPGAAEDEIVWPDLAITTRAQQGVGLVQHGGLTGAFPPLPESTHAGNIVELTMNCSTTPSETAVGLLPLGDPVANTFGAGFALPPRGAVQLAVPPDSLTINCVEPPTPTATPTATPLPALQKSPSLQNLFLTRQGAKIPPVQCVGPQGSNDTAAFDMSLGVPIAALDPKGSGELQELGAFEFEVHYDATKVCVELVPGPAAANMTCFVQDDVTKPVLEGVARIGCVSSGKTGFPDTSTPEGRRLADVLVRPQPDVYSQAIPNQGNGVVVQLLNQKCELADLQGHPIQTLSCDDADVTIRYLEGDVEPDCVVNTLDTQAIAFRWGAGKGDLLFLDRFNLEPFGTQSDDDIDIKDLQVVYGRIGSTCAAPHPDQPPVNPKL